MENLSVKILSDYNDMLGMYDLIVQLSPQLKRDEYGELLKTMIPNNYLQAAVYSGERCVGVSGYWICAKLYSGKYVEIDNFVIDINWRNKGAGKLLLDFILNEGRMQGCRTAMLDAYAENARAHRFYYREGFFIRGFHYLKSLQ